MRDCHNYEADLSTHGSQSVGFQLALSISPGSPSSNGLSAEIRVYDSTIRKMVMTPGVRSV